MAQAAALLSRLAPDDLIGDAADVVALRAAGIKLFGRAVLHERYGQEDVVAFLREQAGHRELLRRLERLQRQINKEHAKQQADAQKSGINLARKATLEAIEASAVCGEDSTVAGLLTHNGEEAAGDSAEPSVAAAATGQPPRLPPRARILAETAEGEEELGAAARLPAGSFRRACGVCKKHYAEVHHFYHRLCPPCAAFNYEKRHQTADLTGFVALVTGGRVRIGYEICLKLLRAGAHVISTSRFPHDAARRYAAEDDFDQWCERLEVVGPLELAHVQGVEAFCAALRARFGRIHILINNAAQTLTREAGWTHRMLTLEADAAANHTPATRALLSSANLRLSNGAGGGASHPSEGATTASTEAAAEIIAESSAIIVATDNRGSAAGALSGTDGVLTDADMAAFPKGRLDETRQPLDLSTSNSWSRRLGEVSTKELLHTLAANAVAPFVLCGELRAALAPQTDGDPFGHIINVSALEGKFAVGKKGAGHPHTNMSKAALNMLTLTSSASLFQERILTNAVDTGWVTDMAPGGVGAVAATHATHVGPPLDAVDGAARVLDPIFSHVNAPDKWLVRGKFWKDYAVSNW